MTKRPIFLFVSILAVLFVVVLSVFLEQYEKTEPPEKSEILLSSEVTVAVVEPKKAYSAKMAIILDDFGYNKKNLEAIKEIGVPMVLAILPNTPYAGQVARFAKDNDLEIILHLPLEPENETKYLEKDTINAQMDEQKIEGIINMAFDAVPFAVGVSNHMGSKATADRSLMALVFNDIKDRKVFFLDSFTSDNSVCKDVAEETKVPYVRRDIFIDNKLDVDYIGKQLKKAEERALKDKEVVVIGHDKSVTVSVLAVKIPLMKENGIKFVKLSDLVSELE